MEILTNREPSTASPRGDDGGGAAATPPPPPVEPSAQGGGAGGSNVQGPMTVAGSSSEGGVVPLGGSEAVGGDQREGGGEEERMEEDSGDKEVAAAPPVEPSSQPIATEDVRETVVPLEDLVTVEDVKSSEEEGERATGGSGGEMAVSGSDEERERPTGGVSGGGSGGVGSSSGGVGSSGGGGEVVMTERSSGEVVDTSDSGDGGGGEFRSKVGGSVGGESGGAGSSGVGGSCNDPKGKRILLEEPVKEQGPVGITFGDYADLDVMAVIAWENPTVHDVVREEVRESRERREREMAELWRAALEAKIEAWIQDAEEEEAELELRA